MSPSRTRKPIARARPRHELIIAIAVGVGIVAGTVVLIWLIRPGTPGAPGSGGLLSRQPRVTLLVVGTGLVLAGVLYWVLRGRRRPRGVSHRVAVIVSVVVIVGGAVALGVLWPDGLVRHYPSLTNVPEVPHTPPDTSATTTPGTTPGTGTSPATTPATVTPSTGSAPTTTGG